MNRYYNEVNDTIEAIVNSGFKLLRVHWDVEGPFIGRAVEGYDYIDCSDGYIHRATDAILAVDESMLNIKTPKGEELWVCFVLGNDDGEAVADWSIPSDEEEDGILETAIWRVANKYADEE
tara:strand:+ start:3318 stop:3680 length:363 start_codon:yes stop_codon:yes gene_type:complete